MKNKNKLELRGVIVPSCYDCSWLDKQIEKGQITPESRFRAAIKAADPKKDIELYINSPGGSVFAGSEIINALIDWKKDTGKKVNITVGAMAASMAAALIVQAADDVSVHINSKIMYHGAWGCYCGGAEALEDQADLLNKINADIKVLLVQRYNLDPDTVAEWFKEGRAGWISASEAVKIGMAKEIIGVKAVKPDIPDNVDSLLNERGAKLAAAVLGKYKEKLTEENEMKDKILAKLRQFGLIKGEAEEAEVLGVIDTLATAPNEETMKASIKAELEAAHAPVVAELGTVKAELVTVKAGLETATAEIATGKAALETANTALAAETAMRQKLLGGNGAPAGGDNSGSANKRFQVAVKARAEADGVSHDEATLSIQRENPELHSEMLAEANPE